MSSRRDFIKTASVAGVGIAATAATSAVAAATASSAGMNDIYTGPHKMIRNCKLLSMKNADGSETLGVVTSKGVIDVRAVAKKLKVAAPLTLDRLLQEGNADDLQHVIDHAGKSGVPMLDESKITFGRLFKNPGKIACVGLNYRQHAKEIGMQAPSVPPLFNKYNNTLAAHQCVLEIPPPDISYKLDYETELLIVIGKRMRNVPEAETLSYVAGYCTSNDFSSRDLQLELPAGQWMIGKTLDQYAPIGPYFVTSDLVGDPNNLKVQTFVNGEIRQNSNTSDFIFNTQQMLSYISKYWTLEPGDIVFTGTPQGVIAGMPKDKQVWLKKGDKIVSSIEKLGELKFTLG
jgi:2-keto-4-pentenoate hydratase/2-oxohepta-3-ene-1,7-dioic acid hydratase in catechol pathway